MKLNQSAGILLFRLSDSDTEVMLVHPGGPFWKNKDSGVWSIPKGEFNEDEDSLVAAKREFQEETGTDINGDFISLKPVRLKSGKWVYAWAVEGNIDVKNMVCNTIQIEWPPKTGRLITIPECDKGEWFTIEVARIKINPGQVDLLDQLATHLKGL